MSSIITPSASNVLFIYRDGDNDSLAVANYYALVHKMDNVQLVAIPCSDDEILIDYAQFASEVETSVKNAVTSLSGLGYTVYVIILGYNVPGGFYDDIDIISSTSRINRLNEPFTKMKKSFVYNRASGVRFTADDAMHLFISSRIDASTVTDAISMIDSANNIINQDSANGQLFYDPYSTLVAGGSNSSDSSDIDGASYRQMLLDAYSLYLSGLDIPIQITTDNNVRDAIFPYLEYDSFFWGWFTNRGNDSFFKDTYTDRIFFYNADFNSAETVKFRELGLWSELAIHNHYACCAGAMSSPSIGGFLDPLPFFKSIVSGGCIGEAYLFSNPYYDWTTTLFGDPLVSLTLLYSNRETSDSTKQQNVLKVHAEWSILANTMAGAVAYYNNKTNLEEDTLNEIINTNDISVETDLLDKAYTLFATCGDNRRNRIFNVSLTGTLTMPMFVYAGDLGGGNSKVLLDKYLADKNLKISHKIIDILSASGLTNTAFIKNYGDLQPYIYDEGAWSITFVFMDSVGDYAKYFFQVQVSDTQDFSNIIIDKISTSVGGIADGWFYYDQDKTSLIKTPTDGLDSMFIGSGIKYISPADVYLIPDEIYYFRWRNIVDGVYYEWTSAQDIIWT